MRREILVGFLFVLLCSCGERVRDAADNTDSLLVGTWDSILNSDEECQERIRMNLDKTFWWFQDSTVSSGTYGRDATTINFKFTSKPWEMVKFKVTGRDLYLERRGQAKTYTKVPTSVSSHVTSLCPRDKRNSTY